MPTNTKEYHKKYVEENRDRILAHKREYYYRNRERLKEQTRLRNFEKYHNDPEFRKKVIERSSDYKRRKRINNDKSTQRVRNT
jgi:hypothetical protein